jgi:hypothetical protein
MHNVIDHPTSAIQLDLYQRGERARATYFRDNALLLPAVPLFYTQDTFDEIGDLCATALTYQRIDSGDTNDTHDLNCARLMGSPAGKAPTILSEHALPILQRVASPALMRYLQGILGIQDQPLYFRRAQSHEMGIGQYIGPHVDNHADPDWDMVIILYLTADFDGGDHIIDHKNGRPNTTVHTQPGTIMIAPVDTWHWVTPVTRGCRRSLIGFLSRYNGPNLRTDMDPPRYG